MRRVNGDMWNANDAVDTVNAAANAIALAETRASPDTSQKGRWGGCLSAYWCFGYQKHNKRIGQAVLVPEPTSATTEAPPARDLVLPPPLSAPFTAPPSSPASFVPSEPPSAAQSPANLVSFTSIAASIYSPGGPRSMFAVGPYAHETQLVSPPAFSTYTTEPSTAPFTPPPESVHLTTPSSPEVPFAQFLDLGPHSSSGRRFMPSQYDYQSYQFYPGSPVGQFISPGSVISGSGTSSPLPDQELFAGGLYYPDVRFGVPPNLLNLQLLPACNWGAGRESGSLTPDSSVPKLHDSYVLDHQNTTASPLPSMTSGHHSHETVATHRVSFELNSEDVVRCVEKSPTVIPKALQTAASKDRDGGENTLVDDDKSTGMIGETSRQDAAEKLPASVDVEEGQQCQRQRSVSLGSIKEFNFDNVNKEEPQKPYLGPNWWTMTTRSRTRKVSSPARTGPSFLGFSLAQVDVQSPFSRFPTFSSIQQHQYDAIR